MRFADPAAQIASTTFNFVSIYADWLHEQEITFDRDRDGAGDIVYSSFNTQATSVYRGNFFKRNGMKLSSKLLLYEVSFSAEVILKFLVLW